jgi:hypothetical protein
MVLRPACILQTSTGLPFLAPSSLDPHGEDRLADEKPKPLRLSLETYGLGVPANNGLEVSANKLPPEWAGVTYLCTGFLRTRAAQPNSAHLTAGIFP